MNATSSQNCRSRWVPHREPALLNESRSDTVGAALVLRRSSGPLAHGALVDAFRLPTTRVGCLP